MSLQTFVETVLGLETLDIRRSDSLDFHNLAAGGIKAALEAAYLAGMVDHHQRAGKSDPYRTEPDRLSERLRH